jgi:NADH:ubiquinone oxidoreductase subunit
MAGLGTILFTLAKGHRVGLDPDGNRYYVERNPPKDRREKRWVVFKGEVEASMIPPEWHAWLHHTAQAPLTGASRKPWQKPHECNHTGTAQAYLPPGHDLKGGVRAKATGDYQAWQP